MNSPQTDATTPVGTGLSQWEAQKRLGELLMAPPDEGVNPEEDELTDELLIEEPEADADPEDSLEESEDADGPEGDVDEDADETLYTVNVAGEEEQVTLPELIAGYSRTGDYKRKTQAVAEERKAVEQEAAQLRQERMQYAAALPRLEELLESSIPPRPDPNAYTDPMALQRDDRAWQEMKANLDAVKAERERIAQQQHQDAMAQWQAIAQQEEERLLNKVPEWQDKKVRTQEAQRISEYLRQQGYTDEEVGSLIDHRAVLIARKAMAYDGINVKAKAKPKRTKTVQPGSTRGVKRTNQTQDLVNRAKKSGKESDAARAFSALLS